MAGLHQFFPRTIRREGVGAGFDQTPPACLKGGGAEEPALPTREYIHFAGAGEGNVRGVAVGLAVGSELPLGPARTLSSFPTRHSPLALPPLTDSLTHNSFPTTPMPGRASGTLPFVVHQTITLIFRSSIRFVSCHGLGLSHFTVATAPPPDPSPRGSGSGRHENARSPPSLRLSSSCTGLPSGQRLSQPDGEGQRVFGGGFCWPFRVWMGLGLAHPRASFLSSVEPECETC